MYACIHVVVKTTNASKSEAVLVASCSCIDNQGSVVFCAQLPQKTDLNVFDALLKFPADWETEGGLNKKFCL